MSGAPRNSEPVSRAGEIRYRGGFAVTFEVREAAPGDWTGVVRGPGDAVRPIAACGPNDAANAVEAAADDMAREHARTRTL